MKRNTVDVVTLGCSKNLVDSEKLMRQLQANGYKVTHDSPSPEGEIVVINTCGFIGDAKEESINTILEFCQAQSAPKGLTSHNQLLLYLQLHRSAGVAGLLLEIIQTVYIGTLDKFVQ